MMDSMIGGLQGQVASGDKEVEAPTLTFMGQWWHDLGSPAQGGSPHWQALIAIVAAFIAYRGFRTLILANLQRLATRTDNDFDDRLLFFAGKVSGLVFFFLTAVLITQIYQWDVSPLLAGAGIAGIALGFAAKEALSDLLAGVSLIADQPFRVGDRIKIERIGKEWGGWGDVIDLGLRRTSIRNTDGVIVNYPNSILATSVITNFSYENQPVRVRIRFQIPFDADIALVRRVCADAICKVDKVKAETVEVLVRSLWDVNRGHMTSGVLMEGRYRIVDVRERTKVRAAVFEHILRDFASHGIELGVPQVSIKS